MLGDAGLSLIGRHVHRVETVGRPTLTPPQLVVAGVDGNAQQPRSETTRITLVGLQTAECAEERLLGRISSVFGVAQRAVANVEQLALKMEHELVERGDLAAPG